MLPFDKAYESDRLALAVTEVAAERAFSSGGERFPDTEEVTSSNLVTPTTKDAGRWHKPSTCFCLGHQTGHQIGHYDLRRALNHYEKYDTAIFLSGLAR